MRAFAQMPVTMEEDPTPSMASQLERSVGGLPPRSVPLQPRTEKPVQMRGCSNRAFRRKLLKPEPEFVTNF